MEFESVIFTRRSVRAFTEQDVDDETVKKLLEYGNAAPSAGNVKPWRFIVIRNPEVKHRVTEATYQRGREANPTQSWIETAPVIIAVVLDMEASMKKYGPKAVSRSGLLDCSAVVENILLGCVALGLGATYIGGFRPLDMYDALGLNGMQDPVAVIPIGYQKGVTYARSCAPVEEITSYEQYGKKKNEQK